MVRLFTVCLVVLTFFVAELKGFTDDNKEVRDEYVKWRKFLRRNMEGDNAGPVMNGKTFGTMLGQFSGRVSKLSRFTKMAGGKFKFLLVGACDGDGEYDPHLNMFYSSIHWQGVFVEAFKSNIDKMIPFIEKADATDRSLILQGAATAACPSPVVQFSVPDVDESKAPHWYAREVGRITTKHELNLTDWKHIDVPCLTGPVIIDKLNAKFRADPPAGGGVAEHIAHFLKIDVEGASTDVLRGILSPLHSYQLPLIIMVEVKSDDYVKDSVKASKKYDTYCGPITKFLGDKGYIVSPCFQDMFAILKPEWIVSKS